VTWGSTVKEVQGSPIAFPSFTTSSSVQLSHAAFLIFLFALTVSNFFAEVPAILKRFNTAYIYAFTTIIGISIMASDLVPEGYRITTMVRFFRLLLSPLRV